MMRPKTAAVMLVVSLLASCTGGDGDVAETTEPPAATTTEPPVVNTTAPVATTTSTAPATTSTTARAVDGPLGSGCSPGEAATLPEGEWFGFVTATSASGIEFDLACWFTGQAAVEAAAEDGEESPPPNDYYVRNDNPQIRSLTVSPEAGVVWYPTGDPTGEAQVTFQQWADEVEGRGFFFGVWLDVIDGEVAAMREQWVP